MREAAAFCAIRSKFFVLRRGKKNKADPKGQNRGEVMRMQDLNCFDQRMLDYFKTLPADVQNTVLYSQSRVENLDGLKDLAEKTIRLYEG